MNTAILTRIEAYRPYVSRRIADPATVEDVLQDTAISAWQSGLKDARSIASIIKRRVVDHIRSVRGRNGTKPRIESIGGILHRAKSFAYHLPTAGGAKKYSTVDRRPDMPPVEELYAAAGEYAADVREWAAAPNRSVRQSARVRAGLALIRRSVAVQ